ncbi:hypothetical protein AGOR_G00178100 [Albula goreensis]|uniref:DM14 domain-containing protein n=1 Tax=Albula goreensis TaxID=1534307 RepID=A0A8T3CYL3_9TELE|nr:hypothetical protein AGOR_G00178100 [Albula goreensis]
MPKNKGSCPRSQGPVAEDHPGNTHNQHLDTPQGYNSAASRTGWPEAIEPVGKAFAQISMPTPPRAVPPSLETLEQRLALYREACNKARASGDDRKARMHDRIAKQYKTAIQAHKAGRPINFEELPVPPGFPPTLGLERERSLKGFAAVLEG